MQAAALERRTERTFPTSVMNMPHRHRQFVFENLWEEGPDDAQTEVDFLPAYPLLYDLTPCCDECGCSFGVAVVRSIAFPVRHRATVAFQCNDCGRTQCGTDSCDVDR